MKLLHIDSSITGQASASRHLTSQIVERFRQAGASVVHRDLEAAPLPHLDSKMIAGAAPEEAARNQAVLEEFLAADVIVIGAPMYNFGISSQLKAWIDRIAVAGKTFRYGANGPEGLAGGRRVVIASTRGGVYDGNEAMDFQESYLRGVLGFIGITDIEIVRAEGIAYGPEQREAALAGAVANLPAVIRPLAQAA
jgi:FMN-dependent NADH-azoreductase